MEMSHGKYTAELDRAALGARIVGYEDILIDLGTGDGRWVIQSAQHEPSRFAIGIDTCRENLRGAARQLPRNALLLIADARALPLELAGLATAVTINFPWGSLLTALLTGDGGLINSLRWIARPASTLDLRLNGGALIEAGYSLSDASLLAGLTLRAAGFDVGPSVVMDAAALRGCASTWARRLAVGREPWALHVRAIVPQHSRSLATSPS
ncbi:MAG: class I SAM-dependent methyltransferase [Herpetosiphonaceae bacterium]|nr:class I SAM-dependent methyltransferase [Herpetosiphonaceae bacterium]